MFFLIQLFLSAGIPVVCALLCGLLPGIGDFFTQCAAYWVHPTTMTGALLQTFPFADEIPLLKEAIDSGFAIYGAVTNTDSQYALFYDTYFLVLSVIVIDTMMYLFQFIKKPFPIRNEISNKVCNTLALLLISYLGTATILVLAEYLFALLGGNYIVAFAAMVGVIFAHSFLLALFKAQKKELGHLLRVSVNLMGDTLLSAFYVALLYATIVLITLCLTNGHSTLLMLLATVCASLYLIMTISKVAKRMSD